MLRLDEEWIRVSLAYDVLQRTGDIQQADESELYAQTYGSTGRNCSCRFWNMLEATKQTISDPDQASAWDMVLRRRHLRRGL
jgi:hypothetical protein